MSIKIGIYLGLAAIGGIILSVQQPGPAGARTASRKASTVHASEGFPTLDGKNAIEHLKERKQYGSLRDAMSGAIYQIERQDAPGLGEGRPTYRASNPRNRLDAYFTPSATKIICLSNGKGRRGTDDREINVSIEPTACGYGQHMTALGPGQITVCNQHLQNSRRAAAGGDQLVTEWYENRPEGLEQGFTIAARPKTARRGSWLGISLEVNGSLRPRQQKSGKGIFLETAEGERVLKYGGLRADDSRGKEMATYMRVDGRKVMLMVDDQQATYPLSIDPTFASPQQLTASDGQTADFFGTSISISGNTALVGTPQVSAELGNFNEGAGAVYIFVNDSGAWSQQQKLTAADGQPGDAFGWSVSVSADTAIIGAPVNSNLGAAYIFVNNGGIWSQQQKLTASDGQTGDGFGYSVSISGDTAIVGAPPATVGTNVVQGAAYVFKSSDGAWSQQQKLTASDGQANDAFSASVSISGDTLLIGAPQATIGLHGQQGATYVFGSGGGSWSQKQKLTASDGGDADEFGYSVSISGNAALIGAPFAGLLKGQPGAAYVFVNKGGGWSQQQKLTASDAQEFAGFGGSVSISGGSALVGAPLAMIGGNFQQGEAYIFASNGGSWSLQQSLSESEGQPQDGYGRVVLTSGNTAFIGSPGATVGGNQSQGAGYIFGGTGTGPGFTLGFAAASIPAPRGAKIPVTVEINRTGGFTGKVKVSAPTSLPAGLLLKSANTETTKSASISFNFKIKPSAVTGPVQLIFTGADAAGQTTTASVTLVVQ